MKAESILTTFSILLLMLNCAEPSQYVNNVRTSGMIGEKVKTTFVENSIENIFPNIPSLSTSIKTVQQTENTDIPILKTKEKNLVIEEIKKILKPFDSNHFESKIGMSFSGSGFISTYHLGVVAAFHAHGRKLLSRINYFSGASAGALVASLLAFRSKQSNFQIAHAELLKIAKEIFDGGYWKTVYSLSPSHLRVVAKSVFVSINEYPLDDKMSNVLEKVIPEDVSQLYQKQSSKKKLFVSVTVKSTNQNKIISSFTSKRDLINVLRASCHVPVGRYMGADPPVIDGEVCIDGGWSNNLPVLQGIPTITISPFSGHVSIGPKEKSRLEFVRAGQMFYFNKNNFLRGLSAFYPKPNDLEHYFEEGKKDGIRFLMDNGFNDDNENMKHVDFISYKEYKQHFNKAFPKIRSRL